MVLEFGLLKSSLFPASSAEGEGFGQIEPSEIKNIDEVKKWGLIMS